MGWRCTLPIGHGGVARCEWASRTARAIATRWAAVHQDPVLDSLSQAARCIAAIGSGIGTARVDDDDEEDDAGCACPRCGVYHRMCPA